MRSLLAVLLAAMVVVLMLQQQDILMLKKAAEVERIRFIVLANEVQRTAYTDTVNAEVAAALMPGPPRLAADFERRP